MHWFDDNGYLTKTIPKLCVENCSHPGPCDFDVKEWIKDLKFTVPRNQAIKWLNEFGCWNDLEENTDEELAVKVLWLACCEIRDNGEWLGLVS